MPHTNVRQYFEEVFPDPTYPHDDDAECFEDMPLDSVCGRDCKKAIRAAELMRVQIEAAFGDLYPEFFINLREMTARVVRCFITG